MSLYNILQISLTCPRCGSVVETTVDCHFGFVSEMADLKIGDRYPWDERRPPQGGGRLEGGTMDGEGYMECPLCQKDAFLRVLVRNDVIVGVEPDAEKSGYLPVETAAPAFDKKKMPRKWNPGCHVLHVASASQTEQSIARFAGGRNLRSFMTQRPNHLPDQSAVRPFVPHSRFTSEIGRGSAHGFYAAPRESI